MSRKVINIRYIWDGIVPRCHVTSLRMILEYLGLKYPPSYLMNLCGFNYGFRYSKATKIAYAIPNPPLGPWEFMSYAAEKIGCRVEFFKDRHWNESWELLKHYVDRDMPVLIARINMQGLWGSPKPLPHLIVLCGYDEEKGVVIVHDPALGEVGERIQFMGLVGLPKGKSGCYIEYDIDDFRKAWDLSGTPFEDFGKNGFAIIYAPTERPIISWAEIIDRNAKLTLGQVDEVIGKRICGDYTWGPDGIEELAADVGNGFGLLEEPSELSPLLFDIRSHVFNIGSSHKADAHSFVAGIAAATGNQEMEEASSNLRYTALHYEEGLAQVDCIMNNRSINHEELKGCLARISEVLGRAAESERKAGESLAKAARALS